MSPVLTMLQRTATAPHWKAAGGMRSGVWTASLMTAAAIGILLGLALNVVDPLVALAAATSLALSVGVVVAPVRAIAVFGLAWAPFVFLLKETEVAEIGGVDVTLTRALGGVLLAALAVRMLVRLLVLRRLRKPSLPLVLYLAFFGQVLLALARAPDLSVGFGDFLRISANSLALMILWLELDTPAKVAHLHRATVLAIVLASLLTVFLSAGGIGVGRSQGVLRAAGSFGGANESGGVAVLGMALFLPFLAKWRRGRATAAWAVTMAIFGAATVLSFSRTAIVGAVVALSIWALFDVERTLRRRTKLALAAAAVLLLAFGLYVRGAEDLVRRVADVPGVGQASMSQDTAGSGRVGLWKYHWRIIRSGSVGQVLFGHGLGASTLNSLSMHASRLQPLEQAQGVHNAYLWLLEETGLVGLTLYAAFIAALIAALWRGVRSRFGGTSSGNMAFGAAFVAYLISFQLSMELFGWNLHRLGIRWYFTVFTALYLAASHVPFAHLARGAPPAQDGARAASATTASGAWR